MTKDRVLFIGLMTLTALARGRSASAQTIVADGFSLSTKTASMTMHKGATQTGDGKSIRFESVGKGDNPRGYRYDVEGMEGLVASEHLYLFVPKLKCDLNPPLNGGQNTMFCQGERVGGWRQVEVKGVAPTKRELVINVSEELTLAGGKKANALRFQRSGAWYVSAAAFWDDKAAAPAGAGAPRIKLTRVAAASVFGNRFSDSLGSGPLTAVIGDLTLRAGESAAIDATTIQATGGEAIPLLAMHVVRADKAIEQDVTAPMKYLGAELTVGDQTIKCWGEDRNPLLVPEAGGSLKLTTKTGGKATVLFLFAAPSERMTQVTAWGKTVARP